MPVNSKWDRPSLCVACRAATQSVTVLSNDAREREGVAEPACASNAGTDRTVHAAVASAHEGGMVRLGTVKSVPSPSLR